MRKNISLSRFPFSVGWPGYTLQASRPRKGTRACQRVEERTEAAKSAQRSAVMAGTW